MSKTNTMNKLYSNQLTLSFGESKESYDALAVSELIALLASVYQKVLKLDAPGVMLTKDPFELSEDKIREYVELFREKEKGQYQNRITSYLKSIPASMGTFKVAEALVLEDFKTKYHPKLREGFRSVNIHGKSINTSIYDLRVNSINYNSPLKIVFVGSVCALVLTVAIAGGEIRYKNGEFSATTVGLVDAIIKIRESVYDQREAFKHYELIEQQLKDSRSKLPRR